MSRAVVHGTDARAVVREVVARGLHPEDVDVDTGERVLPLILDDAVHFTLYMRLYSRALAARNLFLSGNVRRTLWEIGAALVAAEEPPCFLEEVYLAEIRASLQTAEDAVRAGETTIEHHGPYVALTIAENLSLIRLYRRQLHPPETTG